MTDRSIESELKDVHKKLNDIEKKQEMVKKFDNDQAPARSAKGIKVISRGVSKDNPEKAIVVVQALEGVIGKHIQENIEIFEKNGAVMSTSEPSLWS